MALKTQPHDGSVSEFLDTLDEKKKADCKELLTIMKELTEEEPRMWGPSIVGFGKYHYVYESGTEGDWFLTGFSPRKRNFSVYVMDGFKKHASLLEKLGKHKTSVSCLYFNRLEDLDKGVLKKLLRASIRNIQKKYC